MKIARLVLCVFVAVACLGTRVPHAPAAIVSLGDVSPSPSTWSSSTNAYVGKTAAGSVTVNADSGTTSLTCDLGYLGYQPSATGDMTITGIGSKFSCSDLTVGEYGNGTLTVTAGGTVNSGGIYATSYVGRQEGSIGNCTISGEGSTWTTRDDLYVGMNGTGTISLVDGGSLVVLGETHLQYKDISKSKINFDNGTLTTQSLYAVPSQLLGNGNVHTRGLATDMDLIFDSSHGLAQTFLFTDFGQHVNVDLNMTNPADVGDLAAGYLKNGSLTIKDGVTATSLEGHVAYAAGSSGTATVNGATWTNKGDLYVGHGGHGTLRAYPRTSIQVYTYESM